MFKFGDKVMCSQTGGQFIFVRECTGYGDCVLLLKDQAGSGLIQGFQCYLTPGWPGEASEKVLMRALEQCAHCLWMMHPVTPHGPQTAEEWKAKFIAQAQKEVSGE